MKRRSKLIILVTLVVVAILVSTSVSYAYEPRPIQPDPGMWSSSNFFAKGVEANPGWLVKLATSNFTEYGNRISVGYFVNPNNNNVVNYTGEWGQLFVVAANLWIQNESLSIGYTGVAITDSQFTLSVNGPFLKNVSSSGHWGNILPYLYLRSDSTLTGLGFLAQTNPPNPVFGAGTPAYHWVNNGTFTFNFTWSFTPVYEIGPYYIDGNQQQIYYQWTQEWIV